MSSMNFSSAKQTVKPPQRGIFPLDHDAECKPFKEKYLSCLKDEGDKHYLCRDFSKEYLQCRMDRNLMASEDLDRVRHIIILFICNFCVRFECHDVLFLCFAYTPFHHHLCFFYSSGFQKKPQWKMR
jgi:cytochrome c oxidase assembly protein subunit 19